MAEEPNYITSLLERLDQMMESDDADALFISGYLRGHITLIIGQLEMAEQLTETNLYKSVEKALVTARQSGELSSQDSEFVEQAWVSLIN